MSGASEAKALAADRLARAWLRRERLIVRLPITRADLGPGRRIVIDGEPGEWLIERQVIERMVVELTLVPIAEAPTSGPADAGRAIIPADVVAQPSQMVLLDLPAGAMEGVDGPTLQLAVASPSNTWRQVPLEIAVGDASFGGLSAGREAVIATVEGALADGEATVVEPELTVEIRLANPDKWLVSADDAALAAGANVAAIGDEIVQFAVAEPIGIGRFRLSVIRRGLYGSEAAMAGHTAGEAFVLIRPDALHVLNFQPTQVGMTATVTALGVGNAENPPIVSRTISA